MGVCQQRIAALQHQLGVEQSQRRAGPFQPLALLMLNEAAAKIAAGAGRAELEASLAEHLKHINDTLDPHEQLDCLVITTEAWTVDNDLITPTFKVKRNRIEDMFAKNYDRWVGMRKKVVWNS